MATATALHWNAHDLTGQKIGGLIVVRMSGRTRDNHVQWECLCECGRTKHISSNSLQRRNPSQSCGCINRIRAQAKRRPDGAWNEGKSYVISSGEHCYKTRHSWSKAALKHYGNKCMDCGWTAARCDVHHIVPKAKGGKHTLSNARVICPNCHRVRHEKGECD